MSAYTRIKNWSGEDKNVGIRIRRRYQKEETTDFQVKRMDSEQGPGYIGEWVQ